VKWRPGFYLSFDTNLSSAAYQSSRYAIYDRLGSKTSFNGYMLMIPWRTLEPTRGEYDFSYLDAEIAKLQSLSEPKLLIVKVTNIKRSKGSCTTGGGGLLPDYVATDPNACYSSGRHLQARLWRSSVMDRYIALMQALSAHLDDNPGLEAVIANQESSIGSIEPSDYSPSEMVTQWLRLADALVAAFPRTMTQVNASYITGGDQSDINRLGAGLISRGLAVGGPDVWPYGCVTGGPCMSREWADPQQIYFHNVVNGNATGGSQKVAGVVPILYGVEASEMGYDSVGRDGGFTAAQLGDFCNSYLNCSHLVIQYQTSAESAHAPCDSSGACQGPAVVDWIDANPNYLHRHSTCPSKYDSCDRN
jgi:hypothetical protein